MPNWCAFDMRIVGKENNVDELVSILKYDHPTKSFYRILEAVEYSRFATPAGTITVDLYGECAWSVMVCMFEREFTYAAEDDRPNKTNIEVEAERLGLDIEIYSREPGMCFAEHYLIKGSAGGTIIDESNEYLELYWDQEKYPTFEELKRDGIGTYPVNEDNFDEDGYGRFGGYDIYDLVAEWNKDFVSSENLIKPVPENYDEVCWYESALKEYARRCECLVEFQNGNIDMAKKYGNNWKRDIGVYIACYDHQNAALPYPIKITHDPYAVYEECSWSPEDPNQGWR